MRSSAELRSLTGRVARVGCAALLVLAMVPPSVCAQSVRASYTAALARERTLRDADNHASRTQMRALAAAYLRVVARFPRSGYSDNALWQAAGLYALAYGRFQNEADRRSARHMLDRLKAEYPYSSLIRRSGEIAKLLVPAQQAPPARAAAAAPDVEKVAARAPLPVVATLLGVKRMELGNVVRVVLELDNETTYDEERIANPPRVYFDLKHVALRTGLGQAPLNFEGDAVRQVRVARRNDSTTRVAMDLEGIARYSVFALYNPYRLVVDFERASAPAVSAEGAAGDARPRPVATTSGPETVSPRPAAAAPPAKESSPPPLPSSVVPSGAAAAPSLPSANGTGSYSLARQLGLGVARIVIDPGHGGHDPGAQAHRVTEAELVLDIALRLEKLLLKERGIEVVMTRRTDVFIPLEERTAIANREGADLFLSIHANASRNQSARGVETYYLNFASNPEAEAVAARENSASSRTLHALPDIVQAIALNNKLDESRDFAEMVQNAMARRLRPQNARLKSLGVKRAPFVVLIGAGMPSVLAEISFVTNKQEAALLRTRSYRQRIAQALFDAITAYQKSLKKVTAVADSSAR